MTVQIGEYKMDQVNYIWGLMQMSLPKQTWQNMGEPKLEWSTIQLRMDNQQNIIPLGRISQI